MCGVRRAAVSCVWQVAVRDGTVVWDRPPASVRAHSQLSDGVSTARSDAVPTPPAVSSERTVSGVERTFHISPPLMGGGVR